MSFVGFGFARTRMVIVLTGVLLLVFSGASLATGQELLQEDGRINQIAHFGGDALYCVDQNFVSTNQYPDLGAGGFRLLDMTGQELWFVPAKAINDAVQAARESGKTALVAEGRGSFGPVVLYTFVLEGEDHFVFTGYDEYGKPNTLEFTLCTPVGPVPEERGTGGPVEMCWYLTEEDGYWMPCDDCPIIVDRKLSTRFRVLEGIPPYICFRMTGDK